MFQRCVGLVSLVGLGGFLAVADTPTVEAAPEKPIFRIALPLAAVSDDGAGCFSKGELADSNARAYANHIATRFDADVTLCLTETTADSAALAEGGDVEMAMIGADDMDVLSDEWRAMLAPRYESGLGRSPTIVLTGNGSTVDRALKSTGFEVGVLSLPPKSLHVDLPLRVLNDHGMQMDGDHLTLTYFDDFLTLKETLESGELPIAAIEMSTWGRECQILQPDSEICSNLTEVLRERPRATNAFIVRKTMEKEWLYRLIGVHIALHFEAPEAFAWLRQGETAELDPAEATALDMRPQIFAQVN